ncbi:RND family transporter [candidate division KSB1 bacterium]
MREKFFTRLAAVTYKRAVLIFVICFAATVVFGALAGKLRMEMTWNAMVPEDHPASDTFEKVIDDFGVATQIIIALEGPGKERLIEAAEKMKPMLENMTMEIPAELNGAEPEIKKIAKQVNVQVDTGFIANHGMMLIKAKDLRNQKVLYTDYNLVPFFGHVNDIFESEYIQNSDNLIKQEKESVRYLDGMYDLIESLDPSKNTISNELVKRSVDAITVGNGYALSTDKKMLLLTITPTVNLNDRFDLTALLVNTLESELNGFIKDYPDITCGITGGHVITRDELEAGMDDTIRNVSIAFVIILLVFVVSFRMVSGPLLAMLVLISGITWDMGLAYLVIGRLNIFTAMCGVVLLGLGVDFAIHILSAYSEFRHKGLNIESSLKESMLRVGGGLVTGAATTAFAFLALILTSYPAFREFGFVVGAGVISCLAASLIFLPAAIVIKERIWMKIRKDYKPKRIDMEFKFLGSITKFTTSRPWTTIMVTTVVTVILGFYINDVYMNQNYMDMEPEGLESVRLQREIPKRFNMSADNMVAVMDDLEETNRLTDLLNERPAIGMVESITDYLPTQQKQLARIPLISEIAGYQNTLPPSGPVDTELLIEELYRFSDNLTEMSSMAFVSGLDRVFNKTNYFLGLNEEGDQVGENRVLKVIEGIENTGNSPAILKSYQDIFIPVMKNRIGSMANPEPVTIETIPQSIKDRFASNDGSRYLLIIYAKKDIWDGLLTSPFINTVIEDVPGASGMPILMRAMIFTAKEQGALAFLFAFIAFIIILMIDFRNPKTTIIATLPLFLSLIWMLGIMGVTGFPLSVVNVIGLPLILGIGIDDGVHIIHRFKVEGKDKLVYTVSSIGKAIFLTSMTTMLGFGSLIPSSYRGFASLGKLVTLGIGMCFIASVIILPAIMKLIWGGKKDHPGFFAR